MNKNHSNTKNKNSSGTKNENGSGTKHKNDSSTKNMNGSCTENENGSCIETKNGSRAPSIYIRDGSLPEISGIPVFTQTVRAIPEISEFPEILPFPTCRMPCCFC